MAHFSKSEIIKAKPIGDGLNAFRDNLTSMCKDSGLPCSIDSLRQVDIEVLQNLSLDLILTLQALPASRSLPSASGSKNLFSDLLRLNSTINSDDFDPDRLIPLLGSVLIRESDDNIWDKVYAAATESTPPPRPLPFLSQTPYLHTTSSFVNSSKHRKYVDAVLKEELGSIYIGVPGFYKAYFGGIEGLEEAGAAVFRRCKEGDNPLYSEENGWRDWPESAKEKEVLDWFSSQIDVFRDLATKEGFATITHRTILAQPRQPLQGSTAERMLDIGFVCPSEASNNIKFHWSHILILGELKSNPNVDTASKTWRDLGRYAREVLTAQDTRRFVLGFTLCGSVMRLWEFDRVGAIASSPFDINKDGLQFVSTILGFLQMDDEHLGYDPSIMSSSDGKQFIEISRNGQTERLILDRLMKRSPCVAGRATTCWKAHREGDNSESPLVIKDSWQYPEREEEGELLREATEKGVTNVARYYYHQTVHVGDKEDDIRNNVRRGLDMTKATNYRQARPEMGTSGTVGVARIGQSTSVSNTGRKRSSSCTDAPLPPSKRTCSSSLTKGGRIPALLNRVHRRVIVRDYGKPLYKASSRIAMLSALESCIDGYQSLHTKAGLLQGDISTGNLMMNEEKGNPSWFAFLIDLDLAIKEEREQPSGAWGKTGTRAFMAIGQLLGEKHCFMHGLESIFWVLFWICIHYNRPDEASRVVPEFDKWNYVVMEELAKLKLGTVAKEAIFIKTVTENFTPYYEPLIPWVNRLRRVVFPMDKPLEKDDAGLCAQIKDILRAARSDRMIE